MQDPTSSLSLAAALDHGPADKRISILRQIGAGGSISEAARTVGVSYKAAWQALDTLTNLAGVPLVERVVGGAGGGGTLLTPAGQALLDAAQAMDAARAEVLARLSGQAPVAARLALRTSMRNQWPCVVEALQIQGPLVRVQLRGADRAASALRLAARITQESAELLGLAPGLPVLALCKATAVQVTPDPASPAGNAMAGVVRSVARGAAPEVVLQLPSGIQLVGFAAAGAKIRAGQQGAAVFDESSIVIAATS